MAMGEVAWIRDTAYLVQSSMTHPAQSLLVGVLFFQSYARIMRRPFDRPLLLVNTEQAR